MEFCNIAPIAGLEQWGTALSRRHLVLAQHLYTPAYMRYYEERKSAGDFIILDNGAYEQGKPLDRNAYFNYIKALSPDVAVLPDILMSPWRETTSAALRFLDEFAELLEAMNYRTAWMFVPQCQRAIDNTDGFTSREELFQSIDSVVNDGRMGRHITWIGLGRYLATEFVNMPGKGFRRANLAQELKANAGFRHLKIHALGMAAGHLDELKALRDVGVTSIDSSCATWRGWNGSLLDDPLAQAHWKTLGTPCDFYTKLVPNTPAIAHNLEVIRKCLM